MTDDYSVFEEMVKNIQCINFKLIKKHSEVIFNLHLINVNK